MLRILITSAIALALLHACTRRDDGMGSLYLGVACIHEGRC